MGTPTTVWSMTHGCPFHHTIHGPWEPLLCVIDHTMMYDIVFPMTHGKKLLNPVQEPVLNTTLLNQLEVVTVGGINDSGSKN